MGIRFFAWHDDRTDFIRNLSFDRNKISNWIMLAILGCTAITVVLFVTLGYRTFFNESDALK